MTDDLPTLGNPTIPIVNLPSLVFGPSHLCITKVVKRSSILDLDSTSVDDNKLIGSAARAYSTRDSCSSSSQMLSLSSAIRSESRFTFCSSSSSCSSIMVCCSLALKNMCSMFRSLKYLSHIFLSSSDKTIILFTFLITDFMIHLKKVDECTVVIKSPL